MGHQRVEATLKIPLHVRCEFCGASYDVLKTMWALAGSHASVDRTIRNDLQMLNTALARIPATGLSGNLVAAYSLPSRACPQCRYIQSWMQPRARLASAFYVGLFGGLAAFFIMAIVIGDIGGKGMERPVFASTALCGGAVAALMWRFHNPNWLFFRKHPGPPPEPRSPLVG